MPESSPSHGPEATTPSLHPAIYGTDLTPGNVPTILVCPLPLPGFLHEQLLSELSHELKTPLTGIMGLAQVLQHDPTPRADRECQYADLIYQRSQQLLVSINDLFDLAQLCTHQFVLQLRPIELSSVVKTALKVAQHTTTSDLPTVASAHAADDKTEFWMMGDLSRVEQLLTHLIGYFAAQSLPGSHPVLTLRSHPSWLSITLMGTLQAELVQAQAHLSWPYPQESGSSTMPGRSGAVLKFLLSKQLAQLHGGEVSWTIQSALDTQVTVLLPRDLTRATLFTRPGFCFPNRYF
jgi:two-component system, sensor histidine kinase